MSKSRITALVVAVAIVGMPVALGRSAAFATTSFGTSDTTPEPTFSASDRDEDKDEDEDEKGHEAEHNHGVIPPVVIRPHQDGDEYGEHGEHGKDREYEDGEDEEGVAGTLPPLPNVSPSPYASIDPATGRPYGFTPAYNQRGAFVVAPLDGAAANGGKPAVAPKVSPIDPLSAPPIEMKGVQTSPKTPSDIFMESATVGLTAMGVGALALGGIAGVRAIRSRKNPLGDYFYDSEK